MFEQKIYIHSNFNKNEIRNVLLQNANSDNRPQVTSDDKGLLYYDTDIDRPLVWNGQQWKIVKYLDDRDLESTEDVKIKDIWLEVDQVAQLSENDAQNNNDYVEYIEDLTLNLISGTWEFYNNNIESPVLPKSFKDNTEFQDFYEPILKKQNGDVIDRIDTNGNEVWRLVNIRNNDWSYSWRIRFFKRPPVGVSENNLPKITFYKYIGERLSATFSGAIINKQIYMGDDGTQSLSPNIFTLPLLLNIQENQILSVLINGVEINKNYYTIDNINNELIINTSSLDYVIEDSDYIFLNLLI